MLEHSNCGEEIKSKNGCNLQKLNDDIMDNIIEYVSINNLLDTCKEFHKLKKRFLQIELDIVETVKLFKKDEYRDYIYSLIDNPRKQLILNISQYYDNRKEMTSLDFIFNTDGNFDPQYLDILNNVYLYKFYDLSLNHHNPPNSNLPITRLNKEYLNFTLLDVNILIKNLLVDNVEYDIEQIFNKKNIKIKSVYQGYDILCNDDRLQYELYKKVKYYSKKYSITFECITSHDLIRAINKYSTNPNELLCKISPVKKDLVSNKLRYVDYFLINYGSSEISSPKIPSKERYLQSLINKFNNVKFKNEEELPKLTESYIKQMNDEYYKNKEKEK